MRLGDLDALHDHVMEEMRRNPHCGRIEKIMHRHEHESFLRDIRLAPTIDAVLVAHGRWIPIKVPTGIELLGIKEMVVGFIRCSECNMEFDISSEWYSNYCPNCGARMKDGDSDEQKGG